MPEPMRVGMIGCGMISRKYLTTIAALPDLALVACADLVPDRARAVAQDRPAVRALPVEDLLAAPDLDVVLNLTVPAAHADIARAALQAGKHVYNEKPLATNLPDGEQLLAYADTVNRQICCAPDTVLGTGVQTARAVLARGDIGQPQAAAAFITSGGPDNRHRNPSFFYQPGGGPLMDMGPYYITALITLLGPIRHVTALATALRPQRHVTSGPNAGTVLDVHVATHVSAGLEHQDGAISTLITSWDAPAGSTLPRIEIYGDAGTMQVPDPNQFDGPVRIRANRSDAWATIPPSAGYQSTERGIGLAELAQALQQDQQPRTSGKLALHTLDAMISILDAARDGRAVPLSTTCEVPPIAPLA